MKKIPNWIIIVLVLAALIVVKFLFLDNKKTPAGPGKGKNDMPVSVNYVVANRQLINEEVYTNGKTAAFNEVNIAPEISGRVTELYFKEGENISAGQAIVKLNDSDLQAQLQKNKAQIKLAEQKLERLKKLLAVQGISQEEYDTQESELEVLKADQAQINSQLAKTLIKAPFGGTLGLKNISVGSFVSPTQPIVSLVQTKPLLIEFSVPEKYSGLLKNGDKVSFTYMDGNIKEASVYAFEPKIDEATKTLRVRAKYTGNDNMYIGSFVKVFIDLGNNKESIMIPTECIIPVLKGQKVMVCKNGKAQEAMVSTGIRTDDKIQITEGLQVGDTVLTTGLLAVKNNTKLNLLKPNNK